jgi:Na+/melibiose symporter-like transporter
MSRLGGSFWRMYAATATSDLADGIGHTALPLAAATFTRDPLLISGLMTFAFLPWLLLAIPSGALVDRIDRRYAMAGANAVRAAATATLAALVLSHAGGVVALYVVSFVLGTAETVYDSAVRALLPQVVQKTQLDQANSLITVEETLGQTFLGAPVGSALFALAVAVPFVLNAAGFAIATLLILAVRGAYRPEREGSSSIRADIAEGLQWLRGHRLLRGLTLISAATAFAQTMASSLLVLYVLEVLQLPSGDYGLVLLAAGAGALLGAATTPLLARRLGRPIVLTGGAVLSAVPVMLMAATRNGVLASILFGLSAAGVMAWNVLTMSLRQALIPHGLFGRVQGAYRTLVWGAIPLGAVAGGALAAAVGLRSVFVTSGALLLGCAFALGILLRRHAAELVDSTPDDELVVA